MQTSRRTVILISMINLTALVNNSSAKAYPGTETELTLAEQSPDYLKPFIDKPILFGQGKYSFWGFDVYQAKLWTESSNFQTDTWHQHRFALELTYLRDAEGKKIAKRSIEEITKQKELPQAKSQSWLLALEKLFPNVKKAQTITGIYIPNNGAKFFHENSFLGEINDPEFSRSFFDIWFSNQTSAPDLKKKLFRENK